MKKSKVFYVCRCETYSFKNTVFTIYKFSRRNVDFLSVEKVGIRFNQQGDFTEQFKNSLIKYGLITENSYLCSHNEMFERMSNELKCNQIQINDKKIVDFIHQKAAEIWHEKVQLASDVIRKHNIITSIKK